MSDSPIPRDPDNMMDTRISPDSGVGSLLREARLACGEDLYNVAQSLRIRYSYLEAIEKNRFEDLPGPAYAIGFIRAYAEHVGLDGGEVVRRFKTGGAGGNGVSDLTFPVPEPEDGIPGGAILFVSIVVAALAYGGWYMSTSDDNFVADLISSPPETLADDGGGGAETAAAEETGNGERRQFSLDGSTVTDPSAMEEAILNRETADPAAPETPETPETMASDAMPVQSAEGESPAPDVIAVETSVVETPTTGTSGSVQVLQLPAVEQSAAEAAAIAEAPATPPETAAAAESAQPAEVRTETTSTTTSSTTTTWTTTSGAVPAAAAPETQPVGNEVVEPAPIPEPAEVATIPEPVEPAPMPEPVEVTAIPEPVEAATIPAAPEAQAVEPSQARVLGNETGNSRIIVRAKVNSWIQIRDDVANQLLITRLLRAGDSYHVPNRSGLKLLTGNAGALEIMVDGVRAPPIGPVGAVRRDVALDAESLMAGAAAGQ